MMQLLILIPSHIDLDRFERGWPEFLSAAEKMPGLVSESVSQIKSTLYGSASIYKIYSFQFPNPVLLEKALTSEQGERAGSILHQITAGKATILTADYREDSLPNILASQSMDET